MNKIQLRQSAISYLKGINKSQKQYIEKQLLFWLTQFNYWKHASTIGITASQKIEWDTNIIIETAWSQNKKVYVPKCYPEKKQLVFYKLDNFDQLENGYANILEPNPNVTSSVNKTQIELLLVPGILFDSRGYRIGFGGGYYDRFLQDYPNNTVSLASKHQVIEFLPNDPLDIPVQQILTEEGVIYPA